MAYQTEAFTMWVDRRLVMRKSSIDGTGTFATEAICAGERLLWFSGGIVYTPEDWRTGRVQLDPEQYNEAQIGPELLIATPKSVGYYFNHSCDPNVLHFIAWRDIAAGEELTTDYAYCEASPHLCLDPCLCGSSICRGRVTGNDWQRADLQQRYRGYFTPYIESLIQRMNAAANG